MRTATAYSSGFVTALASFIIACGGGGCDSYGPDGVVAEPLRALPSPASATSCGPAEFVSYEMGGYRCLKTAESVDAKGMV